MKHRVQFVIGILLVLGMLTLVALKLLMATGSQVIQNSQLKSLLSVSEVQATDQKKNTPKPADSGAKTADHEHPDKALSDAEPVHTAKSATPSAAAAFSHLEQRELELKRKEQGLQEQEKHLQQMQKEVEQKLQQLIVIQQEIQNFRTEKAEAKNASIRSLAQIYGTMKPKEAAKLLENMDEKLAVNLLSTMKANEAAEILSIMDFKKAAKISEALTQR